MDRFASTQSCKLGVASEIVADCVFERAAAVDKGDPVVEAAKKAPDDISMGINARMSKPWDTSRRLHVCFDKGCEIIGCQFGTKTGL
jgi:hypothetical protein